jgi:hypothetical protein
MSLPFEILIVPQGREATAVERGIAGSERSSQVTVVKIPLGPSALRNFFKTWQPPQPQALSHPPLRAVLLGLCGSLVPTYGVGDWVLYRNCLDLTGSQSATDSAQLDCETILTAQLSQRLGLGTLVTAITSERLICLAQEKRSLANQHQAQVVDMEGSVAVEELGRRGIELAMVRVVSDDCHHDLPDLSPGFSPEGTLRPLPLALAMGRRPVAALRLIRGSLRGLQRLEAVTKQLLQEVPPTD